MGYKKLKGKQLKILQLIQKPQHRGAEIFTSQLANHQKKLGHEVRIVSVFSGKANLNWSAHIKSLEASSTNRFLDYGAWRKLHKIIQDFQPDIIQANAGDTLKYSVLSKKMFKWKPPIIFRNASEVGRYLKSDFQIRFNRFLYKNVNAVISVSQASKTDIVNEFPFLKNRVSVVPVGIENDNGKQLCKVKFKPEDKFHLIHVGGFSFEKNHKGLFNILKEVIKSISNIHLHLLGDGPLKKEIEDQIDKMQLGQYVSTYGFVDNPLDYIKSADILVLPSIIEGLPGVILEAMYCETPVVAYNVGGVSEVLTGETGELIPANDERKFANAIVRILSSKKYAKTKMARENVLNNFMNSVIAEKFIDIYKKVKCASTN